MGSKKHRKRDSSSSSESDSSDSSNDSRQKRSKRHHSEEKDTTKSKGTKTSHGETHRAKRSSVERGSSKHDERYHRRSSSYDKKSHKERSRSREYTRREADKEGGRSGVSRGARDYDRDGSRGARDYDRDNKRHESKDHRYDSRDRYDDKRKDAFRSNDRTDRNNDWKSNRDKRDNRRRSRSTSFDHTNAKWGKNLDSESKDTKEEVEDKQKPNFALSGKLTEETNTFKGVVIKYSEPPEARKPRRRWRLYPFKGDKALQTLYIHRESAYLIGRDRKVVDLAVDHPSCSKQHAALQYRLVPFTRENGSVGKRVRPYLIDLESANGTFINNKKIESKKYVELLEKDVVKFGFSSREYVLLHENSKDEAMDDDVKLEDEEIKEEIDIKQEQP